MEQRSFINDFVSYNRRIIKRLILLILIVLYFAFLVAYNYFRVSLNFSIETSWIFGITSALISTISLIFLLDLAWFAFKRRK
ncbi:MAG: hypothetical protein ACFFD7_03395 [Candidatus Thorarchaeota archaeon]